MVARSKISSAPNPSIAADYYMRPTEDAETRDRDRQLLRMPHAYEYEGIPATIPQIRLDSSKRMREFMSVSRETPTRHEVAFFLAGHKLDGEPTGRREITKHERPDGKTYQGRHYVDWVFRADPSVALAVAASQTPQNRALILQSFHAAADDTRRLLEEKIGITRKMIHGRKFEVKGEIFSIDFTHMINKPTESGLITPSLHRHNLISNIILPFDNETAPGAIHTKKGATIHGELGLYFQDRFEVYARQNGIDIIRHSENKMAMIAEIPMYVRDGFMQLSKEMINRARRWAESKGIDFDSFTKEKQNNIASKNDFAARGLWREPGNIAGPPIRDAWAHRADSLGWTPADVARPPLAPLEPPGPLDGLRERMRALRMDIQRTGLALGQRIAASQPILSLRSLAQTHLRPTIERTLQALRQTTAMLRDALPHIRNRLQTNSLELYAPAIVKIAESINETSKEIRTVSVSTQKQDINEMIGVSVNGHRVPENAMRSLQDGDMPSAMKYIQNEYPHIDDSTAQKMARVAHQHIGKDAEPIQYLSKDMEKNMLVIYGRRVLDGEMKLSDAVDKMVAAEERANKPVAREIWNGTPVYQDPVHKTYQYAKPSPGPENHHNRADKWTDKILDSIDKIQNMRLNSSENQTQEVPKLKVTMER